MAIGANSYGSVSGAGALVPRHSGAANDFAETTRPALATVESWIDQISAGVNVILIDLGFTIPLTQADAKRLVDGFVNECAAAMVNGINGHGRFGATSKRPGSVGKMMQTINSEAGAFLEKRASGFERLGAQRNYKMTAGIGYRGTDESGIDTAPIFQRSGFGNAFTDWDSN